MTHAQIKFARRTVTIMVNVTQMERVSAGTSSWVSIALRKSVGTIVIKMVYALMDAANVNPAFLVNFVKLSNALTNALFTGDAKMIANANVKLVGKVLLFLLY